MGWLRQTSPHTVELPTLLASTESVTNSVLARAIASTRIANARLAYRAFEQALDSERWRLLEAAGAPVQRPLWASTGVKDPALPDTLYVTELVAPHTVTTLPEKTLEAVADHGVIRFFSLSEYFTFSLVTPYWRWSEKQDMGPGS